MFTITPSNMAGAGSQGAGALFSDVSGARAGAGAIKNFGSSSSYPIIENM